MSADTLKTTNAGYNVKMFVNLKWPTFTILAVLFVSLVFIWTISKYSLISREELIRQSVAAPEPAGLSDLHARETETLNNYKVLDAQKGVYQIPIQRAMELSAEEYLLKSALTKP